MPINNKERRYKMRKEKTRRNHTNGTILGRGVADFNDHKIVVRKTRDYSMFNILKRNRVTEDRAINNLVVSIKKRGQIQPIIVNQDLEVIDGQHRLEACKILGYEVAYLISDDATINDVVLINNTQKPWNYRDYIRTFSHRDHWNHGEYRRLEKYMDTYGFTFNICLNLLVGHFQAGGATNPKKAFEAGNFKIKSLEKAQRWGNQLLKIKAFAPQLVKVGKFCMAFVKIQKLEGFSLSFAYEQIEKNLRKFDRCQNQEDWDEAMVKAYNYNLRGNKKRITIKKDGF